MKNTTSQLKNNIAVLCATAVFIFASSLPSFSQCVIPVSLADRTSQSTVIVEARVIDKNSFWNNAHTLIYSGHRLQVYKVFKGNITATEIEIITEGGEVGNDLLVVEPSLQLNTDEVGIFFLQAPAVINSSSIVPASLQFEPYSSVQGLVRYDLLMRTAGDLFSTYSNISASLYQPISNQLQQSFAVINNFNINDYGGDESGRATPTFSSITPASVAAGRLAASQITISGNNFGAGPYGGSRLLAFADANNGGATYFPIPANHIVSWSNTSIVAWVPTGAGSGYVRVTNDLNESAFSWMTLQVDYNESNVVSGNYYQPDLVNDNGSGGYTYLYNTTFNGNAAAVGAFERAMQTWRCGTFVNFSKSGTTGTSCQALDGANVVTFDGACALPNGVLGISYSYYSSCGSGVWYVTENDLKFRTNGTGGITWNYGPAATGGSNYDFESVALHELGHSHQLGHTVLTPPSVMHYAMPNATDRRTLTATSETAGGNDIMSRSTVNNSCGPTAMIALTSGSCNMAAPVANFSASPTSGCNNFNVTFTDMSSAPTTWSWSFPGGTPATSTVQNPVVNYSTPGTYNVTLTVTNSFGSDTKTVTSMITVNSCPAPVANFTGTPTTVCVTQTVTFTDLSTNSPTSWSWSFPGGSPATSTLQNPVITYNTAGGPYNVTLTATNATGSNSYTRTAYITVNNCPPPVANFTGTPTSVCTGGTVQYTDLSTNSPTSWSWSFPSGTPATSTLQNPLITYNTVGVFNVTLTATNAAGSNSFTRTLYITVSSCSGPVNNDCANATVLTVGAPCINGTNVGATTQVGEPTAAGCLASTMNATVWYTFTTGPAGIYYVDTDHGTNTDTQIKIYSASCMPTALQEVGCSDDDGVAYTLAAVATVSLAASTQYWVQVDIYSTSTGTWCINVYPGNGPPNDCVNNAIDITTTLINPVSPSNPYDCTYGYVYNATTSIGDDPTRQDVSGDPNNCNSKNPILVNNPEHYDVWFKFTLSAPKNVYLHLAPTNLNDPWLPVMGLYSGTPVSTCPTGQISGLTYIDCSAGEVIVIGEVPPFNDAGGARDEAICSTPVRPRIDIGGLLAGTYYLRVWDFQGFINEGTFTLCAESSDPRPYSSDDCPSSPNIGYIGPDYNVDVPGITYTGLSNAGNHGNDFGNPSAVQCAAGVPNEPALGGTPAGDARLGCAGGWTTWIGTINNIMNITVVHAFTVTACSGCEPTAKLKFSNIRRDGTPGNAVQLQVMAPGNCTGSTQTVMNIADTASCIEMRPAANAALPSGQYSIVIDGQDGQLIEYDLTLTLDYPCDVNRDITGDTCGPLVFLPPTTPPLPVELISFTGVHFNGVNKLEWVTVSEINNNYFEIQKSADGINFNVIKVVGGAGNSNSEIHYFSYDYEPANPLTYYRLRQVDFDGKIEYSRTITVSAKEASSSLVYTALDDEGNLSVQLLSDREQQILVRLFNVTGELIIQENMNAVKGGNNFKVNTSQLSRGMYFFQVIDNSNLVSQKKFIR